MIAHAHEHGITVRALGGVAIKLRSPGAPPLFDRSVRDIDLAAAAGHGTPLRELLESLGYVGDRMFNVLRGARRQLFFDPLNERKLDVFLGEFSMCHTIPIAARLGNHAWTVPLAELLLTKLQIVQLTERDERDIYTLCYHHDLGEGGLESGFVAARCADDWGLWRTSTQTIERCLADLSDQPMDQPGARELIEARLCGLLDAIASAPKTRAWKRRSVIGVRRRWYREPEEETPIW